MSYSDDWTTAFEALPPNTETRSLGAQRIRDLKVAVRERARDGWWDETDAVTYVSTTEFKVPGDKTSIYVANRAVKATVTAGTVYSHVASSSYDGTDTTVTLNDAVLDSGLSEVYYGTVPEAGFPVNKLEDGSGLDSVVVNTGGIVDLPKQSGCRVTQDTAQTIANTTWTKVQYETEDWDNQNEYDNVTNFRFTALKDGKYTIKAALLSASVSWTAGEYWLLECHENGAAAISGWEQVDGSVTKNAFVDVIDDINLVIGDYIEIYVKHNQGGNVDTIGSAVYSYFSVMKLQ